MYTQECNCLFLWYIKMYRYFQIVFQSGRTNLHSQSQSMRVLVAPFPCKQYFFFSFQQFSWHYIVVQQTFERYILFYQAKGVIERVLGRIKKIRKREHAGVLSSSPWRHQGGNLFPCVFLASRGCPNSLVPDPISFQLPSIIMSPSLTLTLLLFSCKDPCDYIGSIWLIQDNPYLKSLNLIMSADSFIMQVAQLQVLGIRT